MVATTGREDTLSFLTDMTPTGEYTSTGDGKAATTATTT